MKTKSIIIGLLTLGLGAANLFAAPKEGDLVAGSKPGVYLIRAGKRCAFPSMAVLKANGFKPENISKISDEELEAIPQGPVVTAPPKPYKTAKNGDMVKASGAAVYLIREGKRCVIQSPEKLKELGLKLENIIIVSDEDLEAIPKGPMAE